MKYQYNRMNEQIASLVGARPIALSNREPEMGKNFDVMMGCSGLFNRINISSSLNGVNYFITHGVNLY
jgi:hypothetical protein